MYPGAPVVTSLYAPDRMPPAYRAWDIRATFMQRLPGVTTLFTSIAPRPGSGSPSAAR